jgi:ligand-binding SRPBCC domain-containing protein
MPRIHIETAIAAPVERCFDLARDIDLHVRSQSVSGEKAVAGRTSGLIELGESVTWEARHLGVRQRFTSRVTAFDRPRHFLDEMTQGAFGFFIHDHWFQEQGGGTLMIDELHFRSPMGPLGWLVDSLFMTGYLRRLLIGRGEVIKKEAETASGTLRSPAGSRQFHPPE